MGRIALGALAAALVIAATVWAMRGRPAPGRPAETPADAAPIATGFPLGSPAGPASPSGADGSVASPAWIVTKDDAPAAPAPTEARPRPESELAKYQAEWSNLRERSRRTREEFVKNHDRDGDGELNEEEARAARRAMREQGRQAREEFMSRFDTDGDGDLGEAERDAMRRYFRAGRAALAADANGDGALDATETALVLERIKSGRRNGDLNGDGRVDAADAALLLEWTKGR